MVALATSTKPTAALMSGRSCGADRASEAAQAIYDLLHFCDKDQEALLHVIGDYFDDREANSGDEDVNGV